MSATQKIVPAASPTKTNLAINCPEACSYHPSKIGQKNANALKAIRENGAGQTIFMRRGAEILGHPLTHGSVQRHLAGHYVPISGDSDPLEVGPKPGDIEILDSIIAAGFRNSRNWKPTIRDTLEAMKLKTQMTGNSAFDDLLSLFDSADDPEPEPEAPEAVLSPEERPDEHDDDLGEPLAGE